MIDPIDVPYNAGQWPLKRLPALASTAVCSLAGLGLLSTTRSGPALWPAFLGRLHAERAGPAHTPLGFLNASHHLEIPPQLTHERSIGSIGYLSITKMLGMNPQMTPITSGTSLIMADSIGFLGSNPIYLHGSRTQPNDLTDKEFSRAAKCPPQGICLVLPYKADKPSVDIA